MKIVCAPDSFKESMTAREAAAAMAAGVAQVDPTIEVVQVPMADGGEGTTQALVDALGGDVVRVPCHDALGRRVTGSLGWISSRRLAVIEVAEAVGLGMVAPADRDPLRSTSTGVGELLLAALDLGARNVIVGLGGSATNDGGAGMARALGCRLLDRHGQEIAGIPETLGRVSELDVTGLDARLADVRVTLASDVTNPLTGPTGATFTFGPQKGLRSEELLATDAALDRWCAVMERATGRRVRDTPGSGAGGGLGAALLALTPARIHPGAPLVMRLVGLREALTGADLVLSGEGSIDAQTCLGKTPWAVAQLAQDHGVPTVLFGGRVTLDADQLLGSAIHTVVPITHSLDDLPTALRNGPLNLMRSARMVTTLLTMRPPEGRATSDDRETAVGAPPSLDQTGEDRAVPRVRAATDRV